MSSFLVLSLREIPILRRPLPPLASLVVFDVRGHHAHAVGLLALVASCLVATGRALARFSSELLAVGYAAQLVVAVLVSRLTSPDRAILACADGSSHDVSSQRQLNVVSGDPPPNSRRAAVAEDTLAAAAAVVMSRVIATHKNKRAGDLGHLFRMLLLYGATGGTGVVQLWQLAPPRGPDPSTSFRRLGLSRHEIAKDHWREARKRDVCAPRLPDWILEEIVWKSCWPALERLIADGPQLAALRCELALEEFAATPAPAHLRRGRNQPRGMSESSVLAATTALERVLRDITESARAGACRKTLRRWRKHPARKLERPDALPAGTDTTSPPRRVVRQEWVRLDREIATRLRRRPGESELDALRRLPDKEVLGQALWRLLRLRALLALFAVVALRSDAACRLRRCDLLDDYRDADGNVRFALVVEPEKTLRHGEQRVKVLPRALYEVLLLFVEATRRIARVEGRVVSQQGALLPGTLTEPDRFPSPLAVTKLFAGDKACARTHWRERAPLLRRDDGRGYGPHSYRGVAAQAVRELAHRLKQPLPVHPATAAEVLLEHTVRDDPFGYADLNSRHGRERCTRLAIDLAWRALTTDFGARRTRDVSAFKWALVRREHLAQAREALLRPGGDWDLPLIQQIAQLNALDAALEGTEARLRWLCDEEASLVALPDDQDNAAAVEDLRALEPAVLDELRRTPVVRLWLTIPELAALAGVSHSHLARALEGHRDLPTLDGVPLFAGGIPRIDTANGRRRRRVAVDDLNPVLLRDGEFGERLLATLRAWPSGWSPQACRAELKPSNHRWQPQVIDGCQLELFAAA